MSLVRPDALVVDTLARLQLTSRRRGHRFWLRNADARLQELLALMGLSEVLPLEPA